MTRILSIAIAALFLTAVAAPSAEAARRHRGTHHSAKHKMVKHSKGHMNGMAPASRDGGSAAVDQLNQQSLNAARGVQ